MIKKYQLNFSKSKKYFYENLDGTNKLSDSILSFSNFESGDFFSLFREEPKNCDLHEFKIGGKTSYLIDDVIEFVFLLLKSNKSTCCIFDDFNSDKKNIDGDCLFNSNGLVFDNEIYYLISRHLSKSLVRKCLQRSNVIWHSLCVVTDFDFCKNKKTISEEEMMQISLNARLIMVGAYDAESYVIWERRHTEKN